MMAELSMDFVDGLDSLLRCFLNHAALCKWEIVRSLLHTVRAYDVDYKIAKDILFSTEDFSKKDDYNRIFHINAVDNIGALQRIYMILRLLSEGCVPDTWLFSKTVPTKYHLAWLALLECRDVCRAASTVSSPQLSLPYFVSIDAVQRAEALLLLHNVFPGDTRTCERLFSLFVTSTSNSEFGFLLDDETLVMLKGALRKKGAEARALCRTLTRACPNISPVMQQMYIDLLWQTLHFFDCAADVSTKSSAQEFVYDILGVLEVTRDMEAGNEGILLRPLFRAIASKCIDEQLSRKRVYSSLCENSSFCLEVFCCEEELFVPADISIKLAASGGSSSLTFWHDIFRRAHSQKEHFLEIILSIITDMLSRDQYVELSVILRSDALAPLHPLVVLIGWDLFRNDTFKQELMINTLWKDGGGRCDDIEVQAACDILMMHVNILKWCAENDGKNVNGDMLASSEVARHALLDDLSTSSCLYVLHKYVSFSAISITDVENLLVQGNRIYNNGVELHKDLTLLSAFCAVRDITSLLVHSEQLQVVRDTLAAVRDRINALASLPFRLEVIEIIFSLLFLSERSLLSFHQKQRNEKDMFLADATTVGELLEVIHDCLENLDVTTRRALVTNSTTTTTLHSSMFSCKDLNSSISMDTFYTRLNKLMQYVTEARWRFQLILPDKNALKNIIEGMLCSPESMLCRCLWRSDLERACEVMGMFSSVISELITSMATFEIAITRRIDCVINDSDSVIVDELMRTPEVLLDLIVTVNALPLNTLEILVSELRSSVLSGETDNLSETMERLEGFDIIYSGAGSSPADWLVAPEPVPRQFRQICVFTDAFDALGAGIAEFLDARKVASNVPQLRQSMRHLVRALSVISTGYPPSGSRTFSRTMSTTQIGAPAADVLLHSSTVIPPKSIMGWGSPLGGGSNEVNNYIGYVHQLFQHVDGLSHVLHHPINSGTIKTTSACNTGSPSIFAVLGEDLTKSIGRLIFDDDQFAKAERVTSRLRLDLIPIIVHSCCPPIIPCSDLSVAEAAVEALLLYCDLDDRKRLKSMSKVTDTPLHCRSVTPHMRDYLERRSPLIASIVSLVVSFRDGRNLVPTDRISTDPSKRFSVLKRFVMIYLSPILYDNEFIGKKVETRDVVANASISDSYFSIILEARQFVLEELYLQRIRHLMSCGMLAEALVLADQRLEFGAPDFLLCALSNQALDKESTWQFVIRLRDVNKKIELTLQLFHHWPVAKCIEMLQMCNEILIICGDTADRPNDIRVTDALHAMRIYQQILDIDSRWHDWTALAQARSSEPRAVVRVLLERCAVPLARDWAALCGSAELMQEIEEHHIVELLEQGDTMRAYCVLQSVEAPRAVVICWVLLADVRELTNKLFVIQFMQAHLSDSLSPSKIVDLKQLYMGIKILLCLPVPVQETYSDLSPYPVLIIEQMLIASRIDLVQLILSRFPSALGNSGDTLLASYAAKALSYRSVVPGFSSNIYGSQTSKKILGASSNQEENSLTTSGESFASKDVNLTSERNAQSPRLKGRRRTASRSGAFDMQHQKQVQNNHHTMSSPPLGRSSALDKASDIYSGTSSGMMTWVPDCDVNVCMACKKGEFTVWNRRHHCRVCGRVVCGRCSTHTTVLQGFDRAVRCCDECHAAEVKADGDSGSVDIEDGTISLSSSATTPAINQSEKIFEYRDRCDSATDLMAILDNTMQCSSICGVESNNSTEVRSSDNMNDSRNVLGPVYRLCGNQVSDGIIRSEFVYQQAPSTTLASAILELCNDGLYAARASMKLCNDLSIMLVNQRHFDDAAIYHIISLMKQMLFSAKVKFLKLGSNEGVELCDTYLSYVDLLRMLTTCRIDDMRIISINDLNDPVKARKLRDLLIADDRVEIAMEVATKCGVETDIVWLAWGIGKLKLGLYKDAREKLRHCLENGAGGLTTNSMSTRYLSRVLIALESQTPSGIASIKALVSELLIANENKDDSTGGVTSKHSGNVDDGNSYNNIMSSRQRISALFTGGQRTFAQSNLDPARLTECLYYLSTYGSIVQLLNFYVCHGMLERACMHVVDNSIDPEVFVEAVFLPCMRQDRLLQFKSFVKETDPSLERWQSYLMYTCRVLHRKQLWHALYDVQLLMRDHLRAGLASVKFFLRTELSLSERLSYLERAKLHFETAASSSVSTSSDSGNSASLEMSRHDISKHLQTVTLQLEISQFMYNLHDDASTVAAASKLTLFGSEKGKNELAVQVLLAGNFMLASKLLQSCHLSSARIYRHTVTILARRRHTKRINDLLNYIKGTIPESDWDTVIMSCVNTLVKEVHETKVAEKFVPRLVDDGNKINACIACNKLKAAYLIAVKANLHNEIARIAVVAQEKKQRMVVELCNKYLASKKS